jgi:hypothetical protein
MPVPSPVPNLTRPSCRLAAAHPALRRHERRAFFAALAVLAALGAGVLLYSTPQGLGLNDDSIAYIAGARSLLAGQGYREIWIVSAGPVTHFPPGFPGALALTGLLTGLDPLRGARLLNALLFGLNIFLSGWLARRMTGSPAFGLLGAAFFLLTPSLLRLHANAMSEPLFVFFTLLAFLFFAFCFSRSSEDGRSSTALLVLAGCAIGLAYLTRYAALALLATAVAALVILHADWRTRVTRSAILVGAALPWIAAWAVRNRLIGGALTNRSLGWHPITPENAHTGIRTFSGFAVPVETWQLALLKVDGLFETLLIALSAGLVLWLGRAVMSAFRRAHPPAGPIALVNGLYALAYFLALAATMTFFDPATRFQLRIAAPIFVSLLTLLTGGLARLATRSRQAGWALAALILAVSAWGQVGTVQDLRRGGQVYASERWFDAEIFPALRSLPADVAIHTDQPGVVYLYVGRAASLLPEDERGIAELQRQVLAGEAVIALFRSAAMDEETRAYYDRLGAGLYEQKFGGDVIYSAPRD